MGVSLDVARKVIRCNHLKSPIDEPSLEVVYRSLKLRVMPVPRNFPIREFRWGNIVGLRIDLSTPWRLWLKGHALGHVLLHAGDQNAIRDTWLVRQQERQAEVFTGWLFLAETWAVMSPYDLAEYHHLPQECIERWLEMVRGNGAISAEW